MRCSAWLFGSPVSKARVFTPPVVSIMLGLEPAPWLASAWPELSRVEPVFRFIEDAWMKLDGEVS